MFGRETIDDNFKDDQFQSEVRNIQQLFPKISKGAIIMILDKHGTSSDRITKTVSYLLSKEKPPNVYEEASLVSNLFPELSIAEVLKDLNQMPYSYGRAKDYVRNYLARSSCASSSTEEDVATVAPVKIEENGCVSSSSCNGDTTATNSGDNSGKKTPTKKYFDPDQPSTSKQCFDDMFFLVKQETNWTCDDRQPETGDSSVATVAAATKPEPEHSNDEPELVTGASCPKRPKLEDDSPLLRNGFEYAFPELALPADLPPKEQHRDQDSSALEYDLSYHMDSMDYNQYRDAVKTEDQVYSLSDRESSPASDSDVKIVDEYQVNRAGRRTDRSRRRKRISDQLPIKKRTSKDISNNNDTNAINTNKNNNNNIFDDAEPTLPVPRLLNYDGHYDDFVITEAPVAATSARVMEIASSSSASSSPSPILSLDPPSMPIPVEVAPDLTRGDGNPTVSNAKLVSNVMAIFEDAEPEFVRQYCRRHANLGPDGIIDNMLAMDYPRRAPKSPEPEPPEQTPEERFQLMQELLPDCDPTYLQQKVDTLTEQEMQQFVEDCLLHKSYPTKKDYLRRLQISAQQKQYTTEFSVENFLKVIPNPEEYFQDPKRKPSIPPPPSSRTFKRQYNKIASSAAAGTSGEDGGANASRFSFGDLDYAILFLRNHFQHHTVKLITDTFKRTDYSLFQTVKHLTTVPKTMVHSRKIVNLHSSTVTNIPLLQEIAWIQHGKQITANLEKKKAIRQMKFDEAKASNKLLSCQCCFDDEIMEEESGTCEAGCLFCVQCIKTSAEVNIGDGKLEFPCMADKCTAHFSMQQLQDVLKPNVFSRMAQKKQLQEIKSAGLEDLVGCPFCDFASIPAPGDKVFRCMNPDCMKESCRECREPSHVPLRCDEVEKEDEVKKRTYIENKMTEALLRTCWQCNVKFIKQDGCNKMTCIRCGATMCYVCSQPVRDYKHFNGQGGDRFDLCPLYSDMTLLHDRAVLEGAEAAKAEIGIDTNQLKHDPTKDIDKKKITNAMKKAAKTQRRQQQLLNQAFVVDEHEPQMPQAVHIGEDNRQQQQQVQAAANQGIYDRGLLANIRNQNFRDVINIIVNFANSNDEDSDSD